MTLFYLFIVFRSGYSLSQLEFPSLHASVKVLLWAQEAKFMFRFSTHDAGDDAGDDDVQEEEEE